MIRTFLFISGRSMRNRVDRRLRRLREPRYIAGLLVGLCYLYFAVLRNQWRAASRGGLSAEPSIAAVVPWLVIGGSLMLWAFTLLAWLWPSSEPPLKFTGPEVQILFTAPVSRRQLVNYKLLRSQAGILFGVLVAMVFSGGAMAATRGRWGFLLGGWILFSTFRMHALVIRLTRASFRGGLASVPWRAWLPVGLMAAISVAIVATAGLGIPPLLGSRERLGEGVLRLGTTGLGGLALWPFRVLVTPFFASTWGAFLAAMPPALGLLVLNYLWVIQSDALLEDAAMAAEKGQSRGRRALPAPAARPSPFTLKPTGRPELAIVWKNLILLGRYASPRMVARFLLPVVVLAAVMSASVNGARVLPLVLMIAGFITMLGPYMMRNDLRHDMPRLAVLKTWPVGGATIVAGEVLAPAAVLSVLVWAAIAVALALAGGLGARGLGWGECTALALVGALVAPLMITSQLLIQNAAVVLFPGWIPTGGQRPRGVEAMGQQMLMMVGTLLTLAVGIVPPAALAGLVGFLLWALIGPVGLLPAALLFSVVLLGEFAAAVHLLGRVLDRTDPSQVEAED